MNDLEARARRVGGARTGYPAIGGRAYFQDGGRRAGSLEEVRFTDIEHLEFDL